MLVEVGWGGVESNRCMVSIIDCFHRNKLVFLLSLQYG